MLSPYKHIAFDLDGTLVHTGPEYRHKIILDVLRELGGTIKNNHEIDRFWYESGRDEIIKTGFGVDPALFWPIFQRLDVAKIRSQHTHAYDDVETTLRKLKAMGKILSVITGSRHDVAQMELAKLNGVPVDFHLSLHDSRFKHKPDPESLYHVLKLLNVNARDSVYIGNSNEDAYYAKNAGVDFIYLERKEHEFDLRDYAIATIHSLAELI